MALSILFSVLQLLFAFLIFYLTISFVTGAPFVPSSQSASESMIALARMTKGMNAYDLGSGDGRLLFMAAKKGANAVGFEINPYLVVWTLVKRLFCKQSKNVSVHWSNFWTANIKDADVVFVYLVPWRMETLENKLRKELRKGSLVVSNSFIFPHLKPIRKDEINHIYVFRIV